MNHWALFYNLWLAERRRHAITKVDLAAHQLHYATAVSQRDNALEELRLAVDQRERARDLAATLVSEAEWSESDEAFLRSLGERPG